MRGDETNTTTPRMYIASILVLNKREREYVEVDVVVDVVWSNYFNSEVVILIS